MNHFQPIGGQGSSNYRHFAVALCNNIIWNLSGFMVCASSYRPLSKGYLAFVL